MIGEKYEITGMTLEVIADAGDKWEMRNLTTGETIYFNKKQLQDAIKLGKVFEVLEDDE